SEIPRAADSRRRRRAQDLRRGRSRGRSGALKAAAFPSLRAAEELVESGEQRDAAEQRDGKRPENGAPRAEAAEPALAPADVEDGREHDGAARRGKLETAGKRGDEERGFERRGGRAVLEASAEIPPPAADEIAESVVHADREEPRAVADAVAQAAREA